MTTSRTDDPAPGVPDSAFRVPHSAFALTAFGVLVVLSARRHWRVRQMGWVAVGLLVVVVGWVAAQTHSPAGWGLENRRVRGSELTTRQYAEQLLPGERYAAALAPGTRPPLGPNRRPPVGAVHPADDALLPLDPLRSSLTTLVLAVPHAVLASDDWLRAWAVMRFSQFVVLGAYLGFVLPMFTLAYASGAIGTERESRSLVWLMTRPLPRSAVYLGKLLGALPWCLLFSAGGFAALCLAGGPPGRAALGLYWPAAVGATVAFAALFHLIGALFRRPVVVGLVYVFFFEILVAVLPGSLKLLSLTFYARCLMYNGATAAGYPADMLDVVQPVSAGTAWAVLAAATVGFTALGMWLFARAEYRDDV